jgi:hypothetical protein
MPSFASRLQDHVKGKLHNGIKVDADLVCLSHPLNHNAYIHNNMWAYGDHYQINPEIGRHIKHMIQVWFAYLSKQIKVW